MRSEHRKAWERAYRAGPGKAAKNARSYVYRKGKGKESHAANQVKYKKTTGKEAVSVRVVARNAARRAQCRKMDYGELDSLIKAEAYSLMRIRNTLTSVKWHGEHFEK